MASRNRNQGLSGVPAIRAAGYARKSIKDEQSGSIEQQVEAIRRYCAAQGWTYDEANDQFTDDGFSGSKKDVYRPAFERLLENVAKYDRVVVFRFDRLSRRTSELSRVVEEFRTKKVFIVSTSEGFSTDTGSGVFMVNILGSLAAGEAEAISARVSATQEKMLEDGKWTGGSRPFGWVPERLEHGGFRLVLDPNEKKVLLKAVRLIISGKSIGFTARKLNADGDRTYGLTPFSPQALSNMLRSEILIGRQKRNGRDALDKDGKPLTPWEPLLTEDRWNELQVALNRLRVVRPRKGGAVLVGVLRCWKCGGKLTGSSTVTNPNANYRCRNRYATMNGKCDVGVSIKGLALEQLVELAVLEVLKKKQSIRVAGKRMREDYSDFLKEKVRLEQALEVAQGVVQTLRDQNRRGLFNYSGGQEAFEEDFRRATRTLDEASKRLVDLGTMPEEPEDLIPWTSIVAIEKRWNEASAEEKNRVIRALITHIVVKPRSATWKHRGLDPDRIEIFWVSV